MPFNLFALTNVPGSRVVRFSLSGEVQEELTRYISAQEDAFRAACEQEISFDGKYRPDDGETLVINNFDDIDGLARAISNPLGIAEVNPTADTFGNIKALFTGRISEAGDAVILIQHFDRRKIISTNGLSIFHSDHVYKKIEGIGLTVDSKLSAIIENGALKFNSFHLLRQIFDLSEYYKEATDSDITEFASMPMIRTNNLQNLIDISDSWVRRKVSLIQQSQILEKVPMNDIRAVALEFSIPMETELDGDIEYIKLPTNKANLKTILRFLDEDYYKSPLLQNKYLSNSKRVANI